MSGLTLTVKLSIFSVAASIFLLSGCSTTASVNSAQGQNLSALNSQLANIVDNNGCTASFQCKVLEVGARACGGPSKYTVYSTLNTPQEQAESIAKQITEQEKNQNEQQSLTDCLPVIEVQSLCINQQCQSIDIK